MRRADESSSLSRRRSSRLTLVRCHLAPCAVGIARSFNSRVMASMETKPALRSLLIVGPRAEARTSAALECQSLDAVAGQLVGAPQHPPYASAMPATAMGGWYPPSVQFIRQRSLGNEACSHKLSNGRGQSGGAGVCSPLVR